MKSKKQDSVKRTLGRMWNSIQSLFPYKSAPHANIRGILFIQARSLMCISSDLMQKNSISRIRQTKFGLLGLTETWTTPTQNLIFLFFLSQGLSALVSVLIQLGDWSVIAKHWDSKMSFITLGTAFCRFKDKSVKGFARPTR